MMNIFEINKRIGQRPPFQMIEKVLELEPNVSARGIKMYQSMNHILWDIFLTHL